MRNKKYRPVKLWLILGGIILLIFPCVPFFPGWKKVVSIIGLIIIFFALVFAFTYCFEVTDRSIIIKHRVSSSNKKYRSPFIKAKVIEIKIEDISNIGICNDHIVITLKDYDEIFLSIGGYFHRSELVQLVQEIKKQNALPVDNILR